MHPDPTQRFSSRVGDYLRYRPTYPAEVVSLLERHCGLRPDWVVADIGSGTGLLAELFLRFGCEVFGVEPNAEMRDAGEQILGSFPRFHSIEGRAEDTTIKAASVDLVSAGQAFHWFQPERAHTEFLRILKPAGWVVLAWNERLVKANAFLAGYESLLHKYAPDYARVDHRRIDLKAIGSFFGHNRWRVATFDNLQLFDWDGVLGRLHSSSYAPQAGSTGYDEMVRELKILFTASSENGSIQFLYETKVYYGQLPA